MSNVKDHFRDGPAVAAILSVALGVFALGLFTVLAQVNQGVKEFLNWYAPAGPLSGKSGMGVTVWLFFWIVLHLCFRKREIPFFKIWRLSLFLIFLGFLFTFPPFFELFH